MKDFSARTLKLWNEVLAMHGEHSYRLATSGTGELLLTKGYGETIATGNREIQQTLKKLLNGEVVA